MNQVILIGNLTKTHETKILENTETKVLSNSIAVRRDFKNAKGEYETDFINFVAFNQTAELIEKYFAKGDRIGLIGRWQVRRYTAQDGTNRTINELIVTNIEFLQNRNTQEKTDLSENEPASASEFDIIDSGLPF